MTTPYVGSSSHAHTKDFELRLKWAASPVCRELMRSPAPHHKSLECSNLFCSRRGAEVCTLDALATLVEQEDLTERVHCLRARITLKNDWGICAHTAAKFQVTSPGNVLFAKVHTGSASGPLTLHFAIILNPGSSVGSPILPTKSPIFSAVGSCRSMNIHSHCQSYQKHPVTVVAPCTAHLLPAKLVAWVEHDLGA